MKMLFTLLLFLSINISAHCEWFNVNHPDTSNIEVFGNRGDTLFTFQKDRTVIRTSNFGLQWITSNPSSQSHQGIAISREGNIILNTYPMGIILYISTDFGNSYTRNDIISEPGYSFNGFGKINSRYIYGRTSFDWEYFLMLTQDGLNTISLRGGDLFYTINYSIIFHDYKIIGNFNNTLKIAVDSGITFVNLENPGISELGLCEENSKGKLFMLVKGTVFTSIDSGWTWQRMNLNLTGLGYLNIDYHDNIYLRTSNKIFCSYDDGLNWIDVTENLPLTTCKYQELRFSDTKIFVRADDGNIYYRDIYTGVEDYSDGNILTLYPNPVNGILKIKFDFNDINPPIIKIYSVFGENVIETEYKDKIDINCLSPGIYFLHIANVYKKFIVNR